MAYRAARMAKLQVDSGIKLLKVIPEGPNRHSKDVVALTYVNDMLISGADDGMIKVWSRELEMIAEFQAHPVNVYCICVLDGTLYTSSNDGTVKAWNMDTWTFKRNLMEGNKSDIVRIVTNDGRLYAGNDQGELFVFENEQQIASYALQEDIADFTVVGNLVFNARNTDVTVTEMRPGPHFGYFSRGAIIGRFPIKVVGDKVCFINRPARNIFVHNTTIEEKFKRLAEIKAHEMTITTLCGLKGKEGVLLSGGYDRVVRAWDLSTYKQIGQLDLGICINYMCSGAPETAEAYVGSSEGWIGRIEFVGAPPPTPAAQTTGPRFLPRYSK